VYREQSTRCIRFPPSLDEFCLNLVNMYCLAARAKSCEDRKGHSPLSSSRPIAAITRPLELIITARAAGQAVSLCVVTVHACTKNGAALNDRPESSLSYCFELSTFTGAFALCAEPGVTVFLAAGFL